MTSLLPRFLYACGFLAVVVDAWAINGLANRHRRVTGPLPSSLQQQQQQQQQYEQSPPPPPPVSTRTITDVIHRTVELHPFCAQIVDTPEFQRLRDVRQLGTCSWVFPCAVHERFQHSLGVAHLASSFARHLQRVQPELGITEADVLCVTVAGLIHDLGHGPFSHFWEHSFMRRALEDNEDESDCSSGSGSGDSAKTPARRFEHEDISCALFDRLIASEENGVDASPWLTVPEDLDFIKALVRGAPPKGQERSPHLRCAVRPEDEGRPGLGRDKRFLYDIVANKANGLDVDKLDYFQRDSHFSGVVKVSFDAVRLMSLARVALVDDEADAIDDGDEYGDEDDAYDEYHVLEGGGNVAESKESPDHEVEPETDDDEIDERGADMTGEGGATLRTSSKGKTRPQLQVCFPEKCLSEVLHVYQTRYNLHVELYQHRVSAAIDLMLSDALLLADRSDAFRILLLDQNHDHGHDRGDNDDDGSAESASDERDSASSSSSGGGGDSGGGSSSDVVRRLRLSECGMLDTDPTLEGYLQLTDAVLLLVTDAARREKADAQQNSQRNSRDGEGGIGGDGIGAGSIGERKLGEHKLGEHKLGEHKLGEHKLGESEEGPLQAAARLLQRIRRRELYQFVGSVVMVPNGRDLPRDSKGLRAVAAEIVDEFHAFPSSSSSSEEEHKTADAGDARSGARKGGSRRGERGDSEARGSSSSSSSSSSGGGGTEVERGGGQRRGRELAEELNAKGLRLDWRVVNFGCGDRNPLERVRFFDNKQRGAPPSFPSSSAPLPPLSGGGGGDHYADGSSTAPPSSLSSTLPRARRLVASSDLASLPREFQETSLRVFQTDRAPGLLETSRSAFALWCSTRQLCEGGRCRIY